MLEQHHKNQYHEMSKPESEDAGLGLELVQNSSMEKVSEGIAEIQESMVQDRPIDAQRVLDLQKMIGNLSVQVGVEEQLPISELADFPKLRQTIECLRDIEEGNPQNVFRVEFLTKKAAEQAIQRRDRNLNLNSLRKISPEVAKILGRYQGDNFSRPGLEFPSLRNISDQALTELTASRPLLFLDGLTELSEEAAKILCRREKTVSLDGLTALSEKAAEYLGQHHGGLSLDGLKSISDRMLEQINCNLGYLSLNGLTTLDVSAARILSRHTGDLYLTGLTEISDEVAELLSMIYKQDNVPDLRLSPVIKMSNKAKAVIEKEKKDSMRRT